MNNEPVAYVDNVWINRPDLAMDLGIGQMFSRCQLSDHQIPLYTHEYERPHNTVLVPCDKLAEMQAEIDRLTMLCDCMTTESNRKGNEIEALKSRELTDEDIEEFAKKAGVILDERYKGEVTFISREALKRFVNQILNKGNYK